MQPDPNLPPLINVPAAGNAPPPLPPEPAPKSGSRQTMALLLSLCFGLFLTDAVISFVDDSLILFFNLHLLAGIRGIIFFFTLLMAIVVYVLMGFTPIIPKRLFLPVTLFNFVAGLLVLPFLIYFFNRIQQVSWVISLFQVILGAGLLYWLQGRMTFRWPFIAETNLGTRRFSWRNLSLFALVNVFVLLPAVLAYLAFCSVSAVDHLSEGFLALRPGGLTVEVRKYVRDDGKTIQLVPMAHVGDAAFYRKLSESFPTNAMILMEGVTDNQNLLTNRITYKRMATSLGLAEQQEVFQPQGETVSADLDVDQFSTNTLELLNVVMLLHSKGVNDQTLLKLMEYAPPPGFENELFDDLLGKRNRHLLQEIQRRLLETENIIVPWGAAHIPEVAREIQKTGFRLKETEEFVVIQFGSGGKAP